ncbi:MAG: sigma 54-interacting transcriptional regulator [Deltaproteobacteria bacterium]|nr:sigma 54-interacting transcriptional regulator [Deltaproteobacteria bacterium]
MFESNDFIKIVMELLSGRITPAEISSKYSIPFPDVVNITDKISGTLSEMFQMDEISEFGESTDLAEKALIKRMIDFMEEDRAFGLALNASVSLTETLDVCLGRALKISGMDSGGIYIWNESEGMLKLSVHKGLSDDFIKQVGAFPGVSYNVSLLKENVSIFADYNQILEEKNPEKLAEGLKTVGILPVFFQNELIACLNVASHREHQIDYIKRTSLESIVSRIGPPIMQSLREEELKTSYTNMNNLFNALGDFLFVLDDKGNIIATNSVVKNRLGYSDTSLMTMNVADIHPKKHRELALKIVNDMLEGKSEFCPIPLQKKNGDLIPVETKVVKGLWNGQNALFGISRDISNQQEKERNIKILTKEQKLLLDNVKTQIWYLTRDNRYGKVNRAHSEFFNIKSEELEFRFLEDVFDEETASVLNSGNEDLFSTGKPYSGMEWVTAGGLKRLLSIHKTPLISEDGEVETVVCSADDVTEEFNIRKILKQKSEIISLMVELSIMFISQHQSGTEEGIDTLLNHMGQYFDVDRVYLFVIDGEKMSNTNEWCREGISAEKANLQDLDIHLLPWWMRKLQNRKMIVVNDVDELPLAAHKEKEVLKSQNINSLIVSPVFTDDTLAGFIGFDSVRSKRQWEKDVADLLSVASEMISNVIKKKNYQDILENTRQAVIQQEKSLRTILDSIPLGILGVQDDFKIGYSNKMMCDLLGLTHERLQDESVISIFSEMFDSGEAEEVFRKTVSATSSINLRLVNARGENLHVEMLYSPGVINKNQKMLLFRDITELYDLRDRAVQSNFHGLVYQSMAMENIVRNVKTMARTPLGILINGETGTGKEMLARAIHEESARKNKPFIAVNCAALTDSIISSQLFGHKKGAFTGAVSDQTGYFEAADGGTLFLDEIADASPNVQKVILRILEDGIVERIGGRFPKKVNVRIIAATNREYSRNSPESLRTDLYYRLSSVKYNIPPLRERPDDILILANYFLERLSRTDGKESPPVLTSDAITMLIKYSWPGNVRELKNVISVCYYRSGGGIIGGDILGSEINSEMIFTERKISEKDTILEALRRSDWNKSRACSILGISRSTLYRKIKNYGIEEN